MPVQTTDMQPEQIIDTPSEQTADMQPEQLVDTPLEQTADMQSEQIVDTIDEEPATETIPEEEPFTPTFTLVGKSTEKEPALNEEELSEPEPISKETTAAQSANVTPVSEDPNKQLSPDEIAALFAAAESTPKNEEKADAEPVSEETTVPSLQTLLRFRMTLTNSFLLTKLLLCSHRWDNHFNIYNHLYNS